MKTADAAIFTGPGRPLEHRRIDLPILGPGQILVQLTACTLCGSDLHTFDGRRTVAVPTILGHEAIGRIAAFGPDAPLDVNGVALAIGDRITWSLVASCGDCFYCSRGLPQKCERAVKFGHEAISPGRELTGGLAEYCVLSRGTTIVVLPDSLGDGAAAPANCATATCAAAMKAFDIVRGRTFIITGAGMLGLTACAMARAMGAAEVICSEPRPSRRSQSLLFGATRETAPERLSDVVREVTGKYGVDGVIELSGSAEAFAATLPLVRAGGTLALVGAVFPGKPVALPMEAIVRRNLRLIGIHNYGPDDLRDAVQFLAANPQYQFETLVDRWFPLGSAESAFAFAMNSDAVRIGVRPG